MYISQIWHDGPHLECVPNFEVITLNKELSLFIPYPQAYSSTPQASPKNHPALVLKPLLVFDI